MCHCVVCVIMFVNDTQPPQIPHPQTPNVNKVNNTKTDKNKALLMFFGGSLGYGVFRCGGLVFCYVIYVVICRILWFNYVVLSFTSHHMSFANTHPPNIKITFFFLVVGGCFICWGCWFVVLYIYLYISFMSLGCWGGCFVIMIVV